MSKDSNMIKKLQFFRHESKPNLKSLIKEVMMTIISIKERVVTSLNPLIKNHIKSRLVQIQLKRCKGQHVCSLKPSMI